MNIVKNIVYWNDLKYNSSLSSKYTKSILGQNKNIKRDDHIHYYQDIAFFVQLCIIKKN